MYFEKAVDPVGFPIHGLGRYHFFQLATVSGKLS